MRIAEAVYAAEDTIHLDVDDDDDDGDEDDEPDPLEMRIAEAVYAAEDTIHLDVDDDDGDEDDEPDPLEMRIAEAVYAAEDTIHLDVDGDDGDEDDEPDPLEMRIAEAVYAAEDTIHLDADDDDDDVTESYTLDSIQLAAAAAHQEDEQIRYFNFYEGLQKVMEAMGLIKKEAMVEMEMAKGRVLEAELQGNVLAEGGIKSSFIERKNEMVGFDELRLELLGRLVGGDSNRHIIPIAGMGGIGKTTLARNVFTDQLVKEHFDICVWVTISQDYNTQETLREVLAQVKGSSSEAELGEELHKCLFGMRYLVVLDDIWSIEAWDKIRNFFPECNQGSRVIVTTRMSNLAETLSSSSNSLCMSFLNEVDSWVLFSKTVFGSEGSVSDLQLELAEIGKKIVGKCKGLPLSIAVIGGLLATAKSERTQGYWEHVERNLSSIVNLENEEYCSRILKLSYDHLPAYLKPCFLYMGVFDEDCEINVSIIIKLWVSEGLIKPKEEKKSLETVAREYFQELVDRNLVLVVDELKSNRYLLVSERELGLVGMCKMHDLVRDISIREAQKQRFYYVYSKHNHPSSHPHRRIVIPTQTTGVYVPQIMLGSSSNPRSYVSHDENAMFFPGFRLLRTLHTNYRGYARVAYRQKDVFGLVNSRLLAIRMEKERANDVIRSSISRLWNLHTLIVSNDDEVEGPVEFWNMHQLKHVEFTRGKLCLQLPPPPPIDDNDIVILEKLHTLIGMVDFHLNEDVVTRIPNLEILDVLYRGDDLTREVHCLSYLQRLSKLESFRCSIGEASRENRQRICFPPSLKQILLLYNYHPLIELDDVLQKICRLPFVEELSIENGFFRRPEWETIEGQFPRLKTLELIGCVDLEKWIVSEGSHFPILEKLILKNLKELEEIPSEIGEIATLKSIEVRYCSKSVVLSAKKIVEEQEDLYGVEQLSFFVLVEDYRHTVLERLASPNFRVELY